VHLPVITYGIQNTQADWRAVNIRTIGDKTYFSVLTEDKMLGDVTLSVPGRHNVLNALAALIVADQQGIVFEQAAKILEGFKNSGRRFDIKGERDGVVVVDDYAHHPTEIRATLRAARERYPDHKIWAVWQPHTYTRVRQFQSGFIAAFGDADHVLVTPIYAAREQPIDGVSSLNIVSEMTDHPSVRYVPELSDTVEMLREWVQSPAVIVILSAGDASQIADDYLTVIEQTP